MKKTKVNMENFADQVQLRIDEGSTSMVAFFIKQGNHMEMVSAGHASDEELVWDVENIFTEIEALL